jgi:flagellar biosynthesis/type III secretory pathway protein FliH
MLSRWRMQEQHGGARALSQVQYVFLELPKYRAGDAPEGLIDRWAYFFREAENLEVVPLSLADPPFLDALEVARMANFTAAELEVYDQAKIAEQDARGALSLAERHGRALGHEEGRKKGHQEGRRKGRQEGRREGRQEGRREGHQEGLAEGLRRAIRALCDAFDVHLDTDRSAALDVMDVTALAALQERLLRDRRWD